MSTSEPHSCPLVSHTWQLALLLGLFCYDAFFVFKSDVMLTVATQIEAPAKFLFAAMHATRDQAEGPRTHPWDPTHRDHS